ncbi:AraC family transcriptional regulator [Paenibacillus sp. HJGM_3]|uniref:helix-turn-helix transcriptional regulator n=1 Tax=Paenibacillus sp. HJGM_3 TaxID=3379816 RepID=UPI00385DCFA2
MAQEPKRLTNQQFMDHPASAYRLFVRATDHRIDVHWHEFFELALVVSGEGTHNLNGRSVRLQRGSLFLLTPADFHELIPDRGESLRHYNFIFSYEAIKPELFDILFRDRRKLACTIEEPDLAPMEAEFERIRQETSEERLGGHWIVLGALERVIIELLRRTSPDGVEARADRSAPRPGEKPTETLIRKAMTYVQLRFREELSLETVAQHVGLSPNYFSQRFRETAGITFQAYVKELRLNFAKSLLAVSALPVTEICFASGFNTLQHFEREFKGKYGCPPGSWRAAHVRLH